MSRKHQSRPNVLVSIIIPTYQRFDLFQKCLDALPDAFGDVPYEVIWVDNGSPKPELDKFISNMREPRNLTSAFFPQNKGFPAACNHGAKIAHAPLLFFLNDDVVMGKGSGDLLALDMDDPTIGVAGMKLLFPSEEELTKAQLKHSAVQRMPGKIQHVGLATNIRGQVIHMYLGWSPDNKRVNAVREVMAVTGAALMTRRSIFRDAGGFDPAYGMGTYEEVDFQMKVKEMQLKIIVNTCAVGVHYTGATAEGYNIAFPLNENEIIFKQKWYNKLTWTEWNFW